MNSGIDRYPISNYSKKKKIQDIASKLYSVDYENISIKKPAISIKKPVFFPLRVQKSLGCKKQITIFALAKKDTGVAQLVEHWSPKPGVGRSSRSSRARLL